MGPGPVEGWLWGPVSWRGGQPQRGLGLVGACCGSWLCGGGAVEPGAMVGGWRQGLLWALALWKGAVGPGAVKVGVPCSGRVVV